ncbi:MAG: UDP-N-acetylglucosamine 4,6-dehydratase family protein [Dysgonomonas sp.]
MILVIDVFIVFIAIIISYLFSLQIYKNIITVNHPDFFEYFALSMVFNLAFFFIFKTYKGIIRYSSGYEFQRIFLSVLCSDTLIFVCLYTFLSPSGTVAFAYCSSLLFLSLVGLLGFRITVVYIYQKLNQSFGAHPAIPVHIWSVDEESLALAQRTGAIKSIYKIKGFVAKEPRAKLKNLTNLPVITFNDVSDLTKKNVKSVLFLKEETLKEYIPVVEKMIHQNIHIFVSQETNIHNYSQLSDIVHHIRPIQIEDLLGRPEIKISMEAIAEDVEGKTILITGAAGSIGSEIVRQLANFNPKCLICLDQAETPLNELKIELEKNFPTLNFVFLIRDIRNLHRMSTVFEKYRPDIVYHAAAYKHVPLMEKDPCEAVITNVLGTKYLVDLSIGYSVEMFVMISTDKAVNPTNIMGATKRIAEIYVQSCAMDAQRNKLKTKFVTTRFGNVLGSNGSVIPLFGKQIQKGGPVTVTHPEITRYFMTIPEACRLVLEASVIGNSGYIYVFDMGEPVKILGLALRMIELAGLTPEKDIKIQFSNLRPGEKLYEELLNNAEVTVPTSHKKVLMAKVREYDYKEVLPIVEKIIFYAEEGDEYKMVALMKEFVPEFVSNNSEFESLDKKKVIQN